MFLPIVIIFDSGSVGRNVKTHVCRFIEVSIRIFPF